MAPAYVDDLQSMVLVASTMFCQTSNPDKGSCARPYWGDEAEIMRSTFHASL